jgi:hypothetical protein
LDDACVVATNATPSKLLDAGGARCEDGSVLVHVVHVVHVEDVEAAQATTGGARIVPAAALVRVVAVVARRSTRSASASRTASASCAQFRSLVSSFGGVGSCLTSRFSRASLSKSN